MDRCVWLGPPAPIWPMSGPQQVDSFAKIARAYTFLTKCAGLTRADAAQSSLMRAIVRQAKLGKEER